MNVIQLLSQPKVQKQIIKKLGISLILSVLVLSPGFILSIAGYRIGGALLLLGGSFFLMARNYRQPWKWNPVMGFIPPVVALLGLLLQWTIFSRQMPSVSLALIALIAGLGFGWQRGKSHRLFLQDNRVMAERTMLYLVIWALCSGFTQLVGLMSWRFLIVPGLMSSIFSVSMLFAVAVVLYRKSLKVTLTRPAFRVAKPVASTASMVLAIVAFPAILPHAATAYQGDLVTKMVDVARQSVGSAAQKCSGLIEQDARSEAPAFGSGQSIRVNAAFNIDLGTYETDADSSVEFTRYDDAGIAKKQGASKLAQLRSSAKRGGGEVRGEDSFHGPYSPQTGGMGHRAIIQQGRWIIDVDTIAWAPSAPEAREKLAAGQAAITLELASSVFDNGVTSELIDLEPDDLMSTAPAPSTEITQSPVDRIRDDALPDLAPEVTDISDFQDDGITPEDVARVTALITLILVLGGMSVDLASVFADAIVDSMLDQSVDDAVSELSTGKNDELDRAVDYADAELTPDMDASGLTDRQPEAKGTVPYYDPQVMEEGWDGFKNDAETAVGELAEVAPVVGDAAIETLRDVAAFHPATLDLGRILGVKDDVLNAAEGLHELLGRLAQLAGDQYAAKVEQDPNVLAAMEMLTILARRSAIPGSGLIDGSDEALQRLLTERRDEVIAGLERIGTWTGKGVYEAARMALGAQEWENAVNGDLSPLTRIANALAGSIQTAGLLHGAGTSLANRFGDAAELAGDGAHLIDDAARAAEELGEHIPTQAGSRFEQGTRVERGVLGRQPRGSRNPFANQETYGIPDIGTEPSDYIKSLPEGAIVDRNLMHHTGYTGEQLDAMAVLARNEDIVTGTRLTNMDSMRHVRDGTGLPKPLTVKSKTIGELDTYLGASAKDKGLVGLFDPGPTPPTHTNHGVPSHIWDNLSDAKKDKLIADLNNRWSVRKGEFNSRSKMLSGKDVGWDEARGVVVSKSKGTPFAGDIDPVFFRDAKTGKYLSSDRYLEIVEKFKASGARGQHGAEVNLLGDLTRHHKLGSPEWHQAYNDAVKLQGKLGDTHTAGIELVVEMGPDGILRRGTHMGGGLPDVEGVKDAAARLARQQR